MDKWSYVINSYQSTLNHERYGIAAQAMLALVKQIVENPHFADIQPGMAHLALTLKPPQRIRVVHVYWEPDGYAIYLDHCKDEFYSEQMTIKESSGEIIATILEYIQRVKNENA